jgi:DNA-binding GntR family transcriptional regulator
MTAAEPRYRRLARELRAAIQSGEHPVGSQLPPELEICRRYGVSRHTARDAIRLLREAGLVDRRRGAGTTVTAAALAPAFVQPLGGVGDLLQYARDARLHVRSVETRRLTLREAERLRTGTGEPWAVIDGLRRAGTDPVALSRIYLAPPYRAAAPGVGAFDGAVQEMLARAFGVVIVRIEQEIAAEALDAVAARLLGVESGAPALRTLRRYYDGAGDLVLASDSEHPAERFVYAMTYRREG